MDFCKKDCLCEIRLISKGPLPNEKGIFQKHKKT